jgi:hypothetical protein
MASLKSMIHDGRLYFNWQERDAGAMAVYRQLVYMTMRQLASRDTILVNAQSVLDDLLPSKNDADAREAWVRMVDFHGIPRPKPPYPVIWMEAALHNPSQRIGVLTTRRQVNGDLDRVLADLAAIKCDGAYDPGVWESVREAVRQDAPDTIVHVSVWHDFGGSACWDGEILYWLDAQGTFLSSARVMVRPDGSDQTDAQRIFVIKVREGWVLHTFARLNCANVELVPVAGQGHPHHRRRHDPVRSSVWHDIRVTSAPQLRKRQTTVLADGEHREVRFHQVRGHFADYTKGAGLFGNPKLRAVFWIAEHSAGDEELGTVIPSYTIDSGVAQVSEEEQKEQRNTQ